MGVASAKSSYMAPASMAAASMAPASMAAATSMAAAATSGREFNWNQDQERACERDCNRTVHGYLHMKRGAFPCELIPEGPAGNRVISRVFVDWFSNDALFCVVLTARPEALRLVVEAPAGPDWGRINAERHKLFEAPRKPELTDAQKARAKKREEHARVLERLRAPGLSVGMTHELRRHQAILEREIAEGDTH